MEKELYSTKMVHIIKEILIKIKSMETEYTLYKTKFSMNNGIMALGYNFL